MQPPLPDELESAHRPPSARTVVVACIWWPALVAHSDERRHRGRPTGWCLSPLSYWYSYLYKLPLEAKPPLENLLNSVAHDQAWAADPTWIRDEHIRFVLGYRLLHRGEVLTSAGAIWKERPQVYPALNGCGSSRAISPPPSWNARGFDQSERALDASTIERVSSRGSDAGDCLRGSDRSISRRCRRDLPDRTCRPRSLRLDSGERGRAGGGARLIHPDQRHQVTAHQGQLRCWFRGELYESDFFGHEGDVYRALCD